MQGMGTVRVAGFILLTALDGLCQQPASVAKNTLPDAPSSSLVLRLESVLFPRDETIVDRSVPTSFSPVRQGNTKPSNSVEFALLDDRQVSQKSSGTFFDKHLYPSLLNRNLSYRPSSSDSLMGRAMYAASRVLVTRDETGRGRVNTSYFMAVLTSAAVHVANRPYWNRSVSAPFSDFGSTIGNDAGMNLLHEFQPGLEQMMKNHTPKFVAKIEERVSH